MQRELVAALVAGESRAEWTLRGRCAVSVWLVAVWALLLSPRQCASKCASPRLGRTCARVSCRVRSLARPLRVPAPLGRGGLIARSECAARRSRIVAGRFAYSRPGAVWCCGCLAKSSSPGAGSGRHRPNRTVEWVGRGREARPSGSGGGRMALRPGQHTEVLL